jgi:hypothetical protein
VAVGGHDPADVLAEAQLVDQRQAIELDRHDAQLPQCDAEHTGLCQVGLEDRREPARACVGLGPHALRCQTMP